MEAALLPVLGPDDVQFIQGEGHTQVAFNELKEMQAKGGADAPTLRAQYALATTTDEKVYGKKLDEAKKRLSPEMYQRLINDYKERVKAFLMDPNHERDVAKYVKVKGKSPISQAEQEAQLYAEKTIQMFIELSKRHIQPPS